MSLPAEDRLTAALSAKVSPSTFSVPSPGPGTATAPHLVEFRVGLRSLPFLADHGFHDMVVLPGSFYVELVRRAHREIFQQDARSLRQIEFEKPVILADEEVVITVRADPRKDGSVAYELFEAASEAVEQSSMPPRCVSLQVDGEPTAPADHSASRFAPDAFVHSAKSLGTREEIYGQLRRNGNQYGPHFQTLAGAWKSGGEAAGRFAETALTAVRSDSTTASTVLDAGAQLLAAFALERGRTFILKSIEQVLVVSPNKAVPQWMHAGREDATDSDGTTLTGSVECFDAEGACLWKLTGVTLAFIDRPQAVETAASADWQFCVASTFTAEPLAESLRFWGSHFGGTVQVDFAPYNQVFQQLLDPTSALRRNRDGMNMIVLGLEDWLQDQPPALPPAEPGRAAAAFGGKSRCVLPNGLEIAHLNRYETDYVYQEIFGDQCYLRHGIQLQDGDTVIDIGANIGLFSLFVLSRCKEAKIYAYEPSPRVFELLEANCAVYGNPDRVFPFNCGVAGKKGRERFTFYENSSVFSGFHPDEVEDRAAVKAVVRNVLEQELSGASDVPEKDVEDLTTHRLEAQTIECPLTSVSDIIRENNLARIDLLKVDAEKCELDILQGIAGEHWPLIDQIVIEVHDRTRATVNTIEEMLTRRGYRCAVVEEKLLEGSGLFNVYATRRAPAPSAPIDAEKEFSRKVGEFCAALEAFAAATSTPLILAVTPRPPGGKQAVLDAAEERVLACAARHPQVRSIGSRMILQQYPVSDFHDPHSHQLGHMPFTPEGYAAIGTTLFRAAFHSGSPAVKVIALDCDNTLWQGVCGEDGPEGVAVTAPFRHLQEFMVAQMQAGVLIAVCSKNNEADALAVFDRHAGMALRREHLAGWRINWADKPANLRALAAQFNLGLDSFVFIDDNPVECAAVRAGCPEVTVLQLPAETERIPSFLEHVWIFDRTTATREDRERSQWYRANAGREELRAAAPTLRDFLQGLQLRIDVTEAADEQLARVAQLTMRTNQFNFTSIHRTEAEIRDLLKSGCTCLVTCASDRFGDYGLVGVILYSSEADCYAVDTLLLSCRALGKGVEHRMVAELARRALHEGKSHLKLVCRRNDRNAPARTFFEGLGPVSGTPDEFTAEWPASRLAELRYTPDEEKVPAATPSPRDVPGRFGQRNLSAAMQRLGDGLTRIEAIVSAMNASGRPTEPEGPMEAETPGDASALERALATIWKKALGWTHIGYQERFFDAGGTSLKAVMVVAMIRKELKKDVSIVSLFEYPTIQLLAARLEESAGAKSAAAAAAESRGRQRRQKLIKRGGRPA